MYTTQLSVNTNAHHFFWLGAQQALHNSVLKELDEEMSLLAENIWQINKAMRKA